MGHLLPTAELAQRALLPDDPGQALALASLLFDGPPRMFNHQRGLWGYTGTAHDGAPMTIQSTGIGGPSAAVVLGELQALGLRQAIRIGRAWLMPGGTLQPGAVLAASEVLASDGTSRALGAGRRIAPDPQLLALLADAADACLPIASADVVELPTAAADAAAFDLESAAVLAAAHRAGVRAAVLVATLAMSDRGATIELPTRRLGQIALSALTG